MWQDGWHSGSPAERWETRAISFRDDEARSKRGSRTRFDRVGLKPEFREHLIETVRIVRNGRIDRNELRLCLTDFRPRRPTPT